ncbi:MAG TPA: GNAT family N-acetyltransferase, partial [Tepidiformaceae bacterium]
MQSPFEGQLIRLRAREPEDEPLLFQWFNDPEVTQHLSLRYPISHRQEREFIERIGQMSYAAAEFAVERLSDGVLVGGAGLHGDAPENRSAILGIALGEKSCWDGGYGTDTMRTL